MRDRKPLAGRELGDGAIPDERVSIIRPRRGLAARLRNNTISLRPCEALGNFERWTQRDAVWVICNGGIRPN